MSRLYTAIFLFIALAGTVAWSARLMAENDQLQADVNTAVSANESYQQAMHAMAQEQVRLNQQIIERDQSQRSIQRDLAATQRRLRDASRDATITTVQHECMHSGIPDHVLDILRTPARSRDRIGPDTHLPGAGAVLAGAAASIPRRDMGRPGSVCRSAESGRPAIAGGPSSDCGFL